MTARLVLSNVASFALQVTVLVAAGAALARAFRIDEPRAMLGYWRALLLACLLLPLLQPWHLAVPPALASPALATASPAEAPAGARVPTASRSAARSIGDLVLIGLAAGIAARVLWLAIGAYGLRRLRRDASPLDPLPDSVREAQERIGTRADMYVSNRVSGPITFGLLRPVVVFPPGVSSMPAHVQEAIVCHELLHVRRRDWLHGLCEEAVRAVLWFHPAIWWLIGRIHLTREQVVDQATIQVTRSREGYVEALLAVAVAGSPLSIAPAPSFLRRRLLKQRVARILQETTMTTRRLIASLTASAAALALAATFAVRSFPLEAQGRAPADNGEPIQLVKGGEHLVHGERPEYPKRAVEQGVEGDVVVDLTLNERGEVSDARVVSGPEELRRATLEAVLSWHYSAAAIGSNVAQATLRFRLPAEGVEPAKLLAKIEAANEGVDAPRRLVFMKREHAEHLMEEIELALADPATTREQREKLEKKYVTTKMRIEQARTEPGEVEVVEVEAKPGFAWNDVEATSEGWKRPQPTFEGSPRLGDVRTERVSPATAHALLAQAGVAIGDAISEDTAKRIRQAARAMDEHFLVEFAREGNGALVLTLLAR
jgi:TonB family protein